jgi:hypothetical protein
VAVVVAAAVAAAWIVIVPHTWLVATVKRGGGERTGMSACLSVRDVNTI